MVVERRFSNMFSTGEAAHAFETAVRGAALEAGLSVGPCEVIDRGLPGNEVLVMLSGEPEGLDRFAAERHVGTMLETLEGQR